MIKSLTILNIIQSSADVVPDTPSPPASPGPRRRSVRSSASSKTSISSKESSKDNPKAKDVAVNGVAKNVDLESPAGSR